MSTAQWPLHPGLHGPIWLEFGSSVSSRGFYVLRREEPGCEPMTACSIAAFGSRELLPLKDWEGWKRWGEPTHLTNSRKFYERRRSSQGDGEGREERFCKPFGRAGAALFLFYFSLVFETVGRLGVSKSGVSHRGVCFMFGRISVSLFLSSPIASLLLSSTPLKSLIRPTPLLFFTPGSSISRLSLFPFWCSESIEECWSRLSITQLGLKGLRLIRFNCSCSATPAPGHDRLAQLNPQIPPINK